MDLLRFLTAGNVDDGKSTLIGRLLYDSGSVSTDILQAIEKASKGKNSSGIDLSLLTDGLRAEREQGITIDVAYKYFTTPKRKFIIADTPGHVQYTRNMVTGASNSDLAIILIDARNGISEQTSRHSIISTLFGIRHLVVCVNKIDLMDYSQQVFDDIVRAYKEFIIKINPEENNEKRYDIVFIPVSAKLGDNVVTRSQKMPWYTEKTLLEHLESVEVDTDTNLTNARFPVQYVIRPQQDDLHDYRGYAGKIISGTFKKGDAVEVLPAGISSRIKEVEIYGSSVEEAYASQSVILHLEDDVDISRGDVIVKNDKELSVTQDLEATVCWMSERSLRVGSKFLIQQHGKIVKAAVKEVLHKINVNTFDKVEGDKVVALNEIAKLKLRTASPMVIDTFQKNKANGSFILIDENTHETVGGCVV